jgi:hypothetical protein
MFPAVPIVLICMLVLAVICCLPSHSDGNSRGSKMHEDLGEYNDCS